MFFYRLSILEWFLRKVRQESGFVFKITSLPKPKIHACIALLTGQLYFSNMKYFEVVVRARLHFLFFLFFNKIV